MGFKNVFVLGKMTEKEERWYKRLYWEKFSWILMNNKKKYIKNYKKLYWKSLNYLYKKERTLVIVLKQLEWKTKESYENGDKSAFNTSTGEAIALNCAYF